MYAIKVFERWEDGSWTFTGYEKIFRTQEDAFDYAYFTTNPFEAKYYLVEQLSHLQIQAYGLVDLIQD